MKKEAKEIEALQEEIRILKKELAEYKQLVKDTSAPIIPSIIPETILVPLTGKMSQERFELIISALMDACYQNEIETVIIDFTAITKKEIEETELLGQSIDQLVGSLNLMGAETFLVGFTPAFTQELMRSGMRIRPDLNTFLTFRHALQFLMKKKGMTFA
ncbi:STAS domain-containing protein [Domibacillus sp. DTU_2020_1001157_1_SI_ALB_TIR_016]|uniref:STAS domain-containing protein n=1 Tax=Domibacillus sp. DTU_2020_1001157_1_SI_ALB_TIR_016 TaxID=3077789 RepID=UPI0028E7F81C|nr:STAS domain-containing protein [Domibacillus sp. DTU_2020_1001157_1_SI_ALB_TIR_016]WNS82119.1 STAS domain-containing protein [Domibacillus sp. DTU_2020_1001157_1_SI_ALB_TIR_016]